MTANFVFKCLNTLSIQNYYVVIFKIINTLYNKSPLKIIVQITLYSILKPELFNTPKPSNVHANKIKCAFFFSTSVHVLIKIFLISKLARKLYLLTEKGRGSLIWFFFFWSCLECLVRTPTSEQWRHEPFSLWPGFCSVSLLFWLPLHHL